MTLPVVGKVPRTAVYAGGAAVAGIVAYAWWTAGTTDEALEAPPEGVDAFGNPLPGAGDYVPPTVTNSNVDVDDGAPAVRTNDQWSDVVVQKLIESGFDAGAVRVALGRFLARQPLSPAQYEIVLAALGAAGPPPVGSFTPIQAGGGGAAVALPAPGGIVGTAGPTSIAWSWQPVTGASGYDVELIAGVATVVDKATITGTAWRSSRTLRTSAPYRLRVYARNSAGQRGAAGSAVVRTTAQPTAGAMRVTGLRVEGSNTQDITWVWSATPGAKAYAIELIAGTSTVIRRTLVDRPRYQVGGGLQRGRPYRVRVRAVDHTNRVSPNSATSTGRTKR